MNNYFIYDKNNFLTDYFEFKEGFLKCHYNLRGNILIKKFRQEDENGACYLKSKIEFEDIPLKLEYMRIVGEPRIVVAKVNEGYLKHTYNEGRQPKIIKEIRIEDDLAYSYSVKTELIDKILKITK